VLICERAGCEAELRDRMETVTVLFSRRKRMPRVFTVCGPDCAVGLIKEDATDGEVVGR